MLKNCKYTAEHYFRYTAKCNTSAHLKYLQSYLFLLKMKTNQDYIYDQLYPSARRDTLTQNTSNLA